MTAIPRTAKNSISLIDINGSDFVGALLTSPFFASNASVSSLLRTIGTTTVTAVMGALGGLFFVVVMVGLLVGGWALVGRLLVFGSCLCFFSYFILSAFCCFPSTVLSDSVQDPGGLKVESSDSKSEKVHEAELKFVQRTTDVYSATGWSSPYQTLAATYECSLQRSANG